MNMKKVFAGFMAGAVAVSAMATMAVSAKNELTFTQDQSEFTKTWDFTATKFPVKWVGKTAYAYKIPGGQTTNYSFDGATSLITLTTAAGDADILVKYATGGTAKADGTVISGFNGQKVTTTVATLAASTDLAFDVDGSAMVAAVIDPLTGTQAGGTPGTAELTFDTTAASAIDNTVGEVVAAIEAVVGANNVTVVYDTGVDAFDDVTDADVVGDYYGTMSRTTSGNAAVNALDEAIPGDGASSVLLVEFFKETDTTGVFDSASVDSATLKVDGYKYLNTYDNQGNRQTSAVTQTYSLRKIKDTNKWYIWNVQGGTNTSLGSIDIATTFDAYITNYELSYETSDSKQKKSEADDLAKEEKKYYAKIWQETANIKTGEPTGVTPTVANKSWNQVKRSFDYFNGLGNVITSPKGEVKSSEVVHGVTFTGLDAGTYKTTSGKYLGTVTKKDTIYYLGNPNMTAQLARNDYAIVQWDGKSSYINSFKEEVTGDVMWDKEDAAKNSISATAKRNDVIKNVGWNSMLKEIQSLIGDAKGATISFGVYEATTTDEGRGNDTFNRDTDAPLASTAAATDFALAVNTQASNKFYSDTNLADGKLTMNWDDITQGLAAGTIVDGAIRVAAGKKFVIDSLTVNVPAKTLADLTVGEGTTGSEESLGGEASSEAAPSSEAASSEAAPTTSPATGNAPIALAAIPVALAAAVVVAKKRK